MSTATAPQSVTIATLSAITDRSAKWLGNGPKRFWLEEIEPESHGIYSRKKIQIKEVPECTHVLIFDSSFGGLMPHFHLGGTTYLGVQRGY